MSRRSGDSQPSGGSLPRADTQGENTVISRGARSAAATPRHLLTEHGHHLLRGAAWRLDSAGAPKPYVPLPKRAMVKGTVAPCQCGKTNGYGPDPAVASDQANRNCFNCRVRSVAALDPRGADDPEAFQDAIARIHAEDILSRMKGKGGCDCDLPVGRLFNEVTCKPFGWTQGHRGQSRSQSGDWEGGENRSEARTLAFNKLPWWDKKPGQTVNATKSLFAPSVQDRVGRLGGQRYYPCRSYVYADTRHAACTRETWSNDLPDATLKLEFVYGYNAGSIIGAPSTEYGVRMGSDAQDNLRWLDERRIVYFAAKVAVVYDIPLHKQRFFTGHDDPITCLALSPSRKFVATGQAGRYPKVFVWNPMSSPDPTDSPFKEASRRLLHEDIPALFCMSSLPPNRLMERKVTTLHFVNEETLAAVGGDDKNAFFVWDLGTGQSLFQGSAGGTPVYLLRGIYGWADSGGREGNRCTRWAKLNNQDIRAVTTGAKHVGFWRKTAPTPDFPHGEWVVTKIELGDNPLCLTFVMSADGKTTEMFTGHQDGSICNWVGSTIENTVQNAHVRGVTQVAWTSGGLLSGGVDCKLKVWRRDGNRLQASPFKVLDLKTFACNLRAGIPVGTGFSDYLVPKSIDVLPDGHILLGTTSAQIFKVVPVGRWTADAAASVNPGDHVTLLLDSHYGIQSTDSLHGVATYPSKGVVQGQANSEMDTNTRKKPYFASCGPDRTWRIWNTTTRRPEFCCGIEFKCPSNGHITFPTPSVLDLSPNGLLLAIGFLDGSWCVYMDIGDYDGASKQVDVNPVMVHTEFEPEGIPIPKTGWRQIYFTDTSERRARMAELKKLESRLKSAQSDHFVAKHTGSVETLMSEIEAKKKEITSWNDFGSAAPISVIKFAPNGAWIVVAARDGSMGIYSLKGLEVQGNRGSWHSVTELGLELSIIRKDAFLEEDRLVAHAKHQDRVENFAKRRVIPGEIHLNGVRGEVKRLGQCAKHGTAITRCDWSLDCRILRSSSESWELLYWNAPKGTLHGHPDECRDVVWATHTVVFGWPLQGIWPVDSDGHSYGSVVCAVDVSRGNGEVKVCATGDIMGHLKLFRYPCVGEKPMFKAFIGHGSHVKNLLFSEDHKYIISVGSHDCSIFQWRYIPKFPDTLPTPQSDKDLEAVAFRKSRVETQFNRRVLMHECAVTVRLVFDSDPTEAILLPRGSRREIYFEQQVRVEISRLVGVHEGRLRVEMNLKPNIIADVVFESSMGSTDTASSTACALTLMKFVTSAYWQGPSQEYLFLNRISSATVLADSRDGKSQSKMMHFDQREAHPTSCSPAVVPFSVRLSVEWHEIDDLGDFGKQVLGEIAHAANENEIFKDRAGGNVERFFQITSIHKERDALVVDMNFLNDPRGEDPDLEDISLIVLQDINAQLAAKDEGHSSVLGKVRSVAVTRKKTEKVRIPQRLELERAYGCNGGLTCGNMQLLASSYRETTESGHHVLHDKVQLIYTSGNLMVMENCSSGKMEQRFFVEHDEDITCFAVHPNGYEVASADGGAEPKIIKWNSDTLALIKVYSSKKTLIQPTDNDYLGKTFISGEIEKLPSFNSFTREKYVACQLFVDNAKSAGIAVGHYLKIDQEIMCVKSINGNQIVCRRAMQGTVAGKHSNGTDVLVYQPTYVHEQAGGICALAFTRVDYGQRIVSVSANKTHSIMIYEAESGRVTQRAEAGRETILAVGTHPEEDVVVTCGVEHLVFWKCAGNRLKADHPNFEGKGPAADRPLGRAQTFLCVDFCYLQYPGYGGEHWPDGCPGGIVTLTGSADGYIYIWEHNLLQKIVNMAHAGPIFDLFVPDQGCAIVFTAGKDGSVKIWNLADQTEPPQVMLSDDRLIAEYVIEDQVKKDRHGKLALNRKDWSLRNIRCFGDSIFVGTGANEIFRLDMTVSLESIKHDEYGRHPVATITPLAVACGFNPGSNVVALACHPHKLECVTAAGNCVRRWDIDYGPKSSERSPANLMAARGLENAECLCVDYTPDGMHIALGLSNGRVVIADSVRLNLDEQEVDGADRGQVRALKFAPVPVDGHIVLAIAGRDGSIDIVQFTTRAVLCTVQCDPVAGIPSLDWTEKADVLVTNATSVRKGFVGGPKIDLVPCADGLRHSEYLKSWSGTSGDAVSGIHAEDGTHAGVTCAQRNPTDKDLDEEIRGKVLVFGDDFGKVNVAAFPCQMDAESLGCLRRIAHDGAVACIAFSHDASLLVSVGAKDLCLLVWRVITNPEDSTGFSDDLQSVLHKFTPENNPQPKRHAVEEKGDEFDLIPDYFSGILLVPPGQEKAKAREGIGSLPSKHLKLTHCHSYRGFDMLGNVGILPQSRNIVYFAAGVGIVHNPQRNTQEFFTKHRATISCLAMHPTVDLVATGDLGQRPSVWLWDASSLRHSLDTMDWESGKVVMITDDGLSGGIAALCFCDVNNDGSNLAILGVNGKLVIYKWSLGAKVTEVQTEMERGRHVLSVCSDGRTHLVTSGVDHIKFWTLEGRTMSQAIGVFGKMTGIQQVYLCSKFLDSSTIVTGTQDGSLYVWNILGVLIHIVKTGEAHGENEVFDLSVQPASVGAGSVFYVLSGGGRQIILWKIEKKDDDAIPSSIRHQKITQIPIPEHESRLRAPADGVRSIFIRSGQLIVGTSFNSLYLYLLDPEAHGASPGNHRVLSSGHAEGTHKEGRITCVCCSPACSQPAHKTAKDYVEGRCACCFLFVTGGSDETLILWDGRLADPDARKKIDTFKADSTPMAMDWSTDKAADKSWVGVIFKDGAIRILTVAGGAKLQEAAGSGIAGSGCGEALRFSPDAKFLAAGRRNGRLDLYGGAGDGKFQHVRSFGVHSGPCCALDWAEGKDSVGKDCLFLRSNAYRPTEELLFFQVLEATKDGVRQVGRTKDVEKCVWQREVCRVSWMAKGLIKGEGAGTASEYRPAAFVPCLASPSSPTDEHMACGSEDGVLRLFAKPCLSIRAYGRPYHGHVEPICSAAYALKCDWLVSTSVNLSLLQWEVVERSLGYSVSVVGGVSNTDVVVKLSKELDRFGQDLRLHRYKSALDRLDDAYEMAAELHNPEEETLKIIREAKRLLDHSSTHGEELLHNSSERIAKGDIDRNGYPASGWLSEAQNMTEVLGAESSLGTLAEEYVELLQPGVDKMAAIFAQADDLLGQLTSLTAQLHAGFKAADAAQNLVLAVRSGLSGVQLALGTSAELPGLEEVAGMEQVCGDCRQKGKEATAALQEAREAALKTHREHGDFAHVLHKIELLEIDVKVENEQVAVLEKFLGLAQVIASLKAGASTEAVNENPSQRIEQFDSLIIAVEETSRYLISHAIQHKIPTISKLVHHKQGIAGAIAEAGAAAAAAAAAADDKEYADDEFDDAEDGGKADESNKPTAEQESGFGAVLDESGGDEEVEDWQEPEAGRPHVTPPGDDESFEEEMNSDVE